jgi:hypothetical protein
MVKLEIDLHESDILFLRAMASMSTTSTMIEGYDEPAIIPKTIEDVAADMLSKQIREAELQLKGCGVYRRM